MAAISKPQPLFIKPAGFLSRPQAASLRLKTSEGSKPVKQMASKAASLKALYAGAFSLSDALKIAGEVWTMLAKRIIPCLDVKAGRVVKGTISSSSATPVILWSLQPNMNGSRPMN